MHKVVVFAGPSTHGLSDRHLLSDQLEWRPPVRRGDVAALVKERESSTLVVCDGVFQAEPAVSHREICDALDAGWEVWGVSSLGAIRAAEMAHLGMRGYGYVYERFANDPDFCDDEACLLYFPERPYFPVTEPLVNVRYALETFGSCFDIESNQAAETISKLRLLWFGDRTPSRIESLLKEAGAPPSGVAGFMAELRGRQRKQLDLDELLTASPWSLVRGNGRHN